MLPGPDYIYKCPKCDNLISKGSLLSGNTFDAKLYSDGKTIAPMLPESPDLTKCNNCNEIFWLSNLKPIGEREWGGFIKSIWDDEKMKLIDPWEGAQTAEFLSIDDYFRALESGIAKDKDEEQFIRMYIWWTFNDRKRKRRKIFTDTNDELRWTENCKNLIAILEKAKIRPQNKFMRAEIYRNLGEFDKCISTLQSINDSNYVDFIDILTKECERGNRWVVELKQ